MDKPMTKEALKGAEVVNQYTGERWVYSDTVKDHFFHPQNLLLIDPKEGEFDAHGVVGSPACLEPETGVYFSDTFRSIEHASIGDQVLAHDNKYHSIIRVYRPQYQGKLKKLKTRLGEIVVTPDHLVFSKVIPKQWGPFVHTRRKIKLPTTWHHASELNIGDVCAYPIPKIVKTVKEMDVLQERKKWDFKSRAVPSKIPLNNETLELFGYYIAEGHSRSTDTSFTFSSKELTYGKRVQVLVKKYFGCHSDIKIRKNRLDVLVYSVHFSNFLGKNFGKTAESKHVPEFFLYLDPEVQKGLLKGVWRGDGYVNLAREYPRAGYATISRLLTRQLKLLLLRQRIVPSIYIEKAKVVRGTNHRKSYRLHVGDTDSLKRLATILGKRYEHNQTKRITKRIWSDEEYIYTPICKTYNIPFIGGRLRNLEVADVRAYLTDAFLVHNCGDVMDVWIKVDREQDKIINFKWRTFGCGSAIASTSMFSVMITENGGMKIDEALKVRPQDVMERLGGLPNRKIHCSVLADKAFRKAVNEYFRATGQHERVRVDGAKVIDKRLNITDKDIEEAVLEGAQTLEDVQHKLKVGIGDPEAVPEIEQLIRFYKEKYFG